MIFHRLTRLRRIAEHRAVRIDNRNAQIGLIVELTQRRIERGCIPRIENILKRRLDNLRVENQRILFLLHRVVAEIIQQNDAEQGKRDKDDEQERGDKTARNLRMKQKLSSFRKSLDIRRSWEYFLWMLS